MGGFGFEWSFKPLEFCSKFFLFVPLNLRSSRLQGISILILGILVCLSNLIINGSRGLHIAGFISRMKKGSIYDNAWDHFKDNPDVLLHFFNDIISATFYLSLPLAYFIFISMVFLRNNWTSLQFVLQEFQKDMKLTPRFYRACRKKCLLGILLLILDAAVFKWRYQYDNYYVADERLEPLLLKEFIVMNRPLSFLAAFWARLADITVLVVFVVITLTATLLFEELTSRAETMVTEAYDNVDIPMLSTTLSGELENLRRHYDSICKFIEKISSIFGIILLLNIAKGFAIPIFEFYKILLSKGKTSRYYWEFLHTILRFFAILVPSYIVSQQAKGFGGSFSQLSFNNGPISLQTQLQTIILQVSEISAPSISALEIVKLDNLSLFLSVIDSAFQWGANIFSSTILAIAAYSGLEKHRQQTGYLRNALAELSGSFVMNSLCPNGEDYSPCVCPDANNSAAIFCLLITTQDLRRLFKSVMPARLHGLQLIFNTDPSFPEDAFVNHCFVEIRLSGISTSHEMRPQIYIHPEAFRLSRKTMRRVYIDSLDMSTLDFNFLAVFDDLEVLDVKGWNVSLTNLLQGAPPSLTYLILQTKSWLDRPPINSTRPITKILPVSPLRYIYLGGSLIGDDKAAEILDWALANSPNGSQVESIDLDYNHLTRIPTQINAFTNLKELRIDRQRTRESVFISAFSLPTFPPLQHLSLSSFTDMMDIEAGAFKTVHSNNSVMIDLCGNGLTRLSPSVFEEIFERIFLNGGMIALCWNPFNCTDICHLSWLLRDRRELLGATTGKYRTDNIYTLIDSEPICANGTRFVDLKLEGFNHCP